jgi:hypothetical protein
MMIRSAARLIAVSFAVSALGCSTLSGTHASSCADTMRDPDQLQALAEAASAEQNWELAYRYVALVHVLHPGSEKDRELFPAAATLFRRSWAPHRAELDSIWTTSEPQFVYAWLASFFANGGEFPQQQMDTLFVGTSYSLFRNFVNYAKERPHISRWAISAEDENGITTRVTGTPAPSPGA